MSKMNTSSNLSAFTFTLLLTLKVVIGLDCDLSFSKRVYLSSIQLDEGAIHSISTSSDNDVPFSSSAETFSTISSQRYCQISSFARKAKFACGMLRHETLNEKGQVVEYKIRDCVGYVDKINLGQCSNGSINSLSTDGIFLAAAEDHFVNELREAGFNTQTQFYWSFCATSNCNRNASRTVEYEYKSGSNKSLQINITSVLIITTLFIFSIF